MTNPFHDVKAFMVAAGQTAGELNEEQAKLYEKLITEEYIEFRDAIADQDKTEQLDACFDLIWVTIGYMHSMGWKCGEAWAEGSWSNHSKIDKETGKVLKRPDGKIMKPEGWQPPNFRKFVNE